MVDFIHAILMVVRRWLFEKLIAYLERELPVTPETLTQEQRDGLFSQLWQNAAFRNYVAERNGKIIYALAGGEGMDPEPRDKYLMKLGQRVEILLLGSASKKAYERVMKRAEERRKEELEREQEVT